MVFGLSGFRDKKIEERNFPVNGNSLQKFIESMKSVSNTTENVRKKVERLKVIVHEYCGGDPGNRYGKN